MADTEVKKEGGGNGIITLIVKSNTDDGVVFKVKKNTKFSRIKEAYCNKKALDPTLMKFFYDGQELGSDVAPADLDMEDDDVVDASRCLPSTTWRQVLGLD